MGTYLICPNCGNTEEGTRIIRCKKCGGIFCSSCDERPGMLSISGNRYPVCKAEAKWPSDGTHLGNISRS